jgi:hypothetical protein
MITDTWIRSILSQSCPAQCDTVLKTWQALDVSTARQSWSGQLFKLIIFSKSSLGGRPSISAAVS